MAEVSSMSYGFSFMFTFRFCVVQFDGLKRFDDLHVLVNGEETFRRYAKHIVGVDDRYDISAGQRLTIILHVVPALIRMVVIPRQFIVGADVAADAIGTSDDFIATESILTSMSEL